MGRTATDIKTPAAEPVYNEKAFEVLEAQSKELVALNAEQASQAITIAKQIGYLGELTVGSLEDGIRFYQRRTVEAILETGKRLLILKELTPHGEFTTRVELLGFSDRTARRFMQAAAKTAKSAILADLSCQAKNGLAFLELVTHDDDVLQGLGEMDDFDRLSASQLRTKARELEAEKAATEKLLESKDQKINKLTRQVQKFKVSVDLPEHYKAAEQVAAAMRSEAIARIRSLREIRQQAMAERPTEEADQAVHDELLASMAVTLRDAFLAVEEELGRSMKDFQDTLGMFLPDAQND